jgi:hypothetical protein
VVVGAVAPDVAGSEDGVRPATFGADIKGMGPEEIIGTGIPRPTGTAWPIVTFAVSRWI